MFEYDREGNVTKQTIKGAFKDKPEVPNQFLAISLSPNIDGNIEKLEYQIDNRSQVYGFKYDEEKLTEINLPTASVVTVALDPLGRLSKTEIKGVVADEYRYQQNSDSTTHLINLHIQNGRRTRYKYDKHGNIIEVQDEFGEILATYEYDELNRLIKDGEKEIVYGDNGNIRFTRKDGTITKYRYDGDKLLSFNGEKFEYDELGNPTTYRCKCHI